MRSIVRTEIISVSELSRVPHVVGPLTVMPNFFLPGVYQPPRHFIGPTNITEIIDMFICTPAGNKVFPQRAHASTIIPSVNRIRYVP
jgi:hypothetical protein